ncbi:hypothetical protein CDL12_11319 [Handroanthus impetiginosus]|uniref:RING-type E3 ubiquitin transferase n=1 Tax=Handroanthus impetiginosus TaxID=429701 RepID=A0A2G9HF04_9LAMI|nr:hypothetical protein CDL12_11319 [Handroanthus impetiginosus]
MGQRNIQFNSHMIDLETDHQGRNNLHPEPCIFYRNVANFPQPSIHSVVPPPGNPCNFNLNHLQEQHDGTLIYGMQQLNGVPPHPTTNRDLAVAPSSGHYNPYLAPSDSYGRNMPYMDAIRGSFKGKFTEGASAGPSSSVRPVTSMSAESGVTVMDAASFLPSEYGANDPTSMVESGSHRSMRNRPGVIGPESILAHNASHLIQGNYVVPPIPLPSNPWLDMHFGVTHSPLPYVHASNRSSNSLLHPSLPQGHIHPHHPPPMQAVRGFNANPPSQVATSSRRVSTINSSNTSINPLQDVADVGPSFLPSFPPMGFRFYHPQPREIVIDTSARPHILPHLRVLHEDIPGYHEAGDSTDQHRDLRLDIDDMSYEELLALEEQIGSVGTGLSEEFIRNNLKIRTFTSSGASFNLEEPPSSDQQINFCVICQTDYEDEVIIGILDCGHDYHKDCIKKWLLMKNSCPVCKSTALSHKAKDL